MSLRNIETNGSYVLGTVDEISMQNPIMVKKVRLQIPSDSIDLIQDSLTWAVNQEECLKITIKEGLSGFNSLPEPITTSYISSFSLESVSIGGDGRIFQTYGDSGVEYSYDFYLKDHLGSTRMVINSQDQITEAVAYQAYGAMVPLDSIANAPEIPAREKFTGKEFDQEGEDSANGVIGIQAYHFGARVYDPDVGIFLSIDPQDVFWNTYSYCGSDPVNLVDPDGENPFLGMLIGWAAGTVIGGVTGGVIANQTGGDVFWGVMAGMAWGGVAGALGGYGIGSGIAGAGGAATAGAAGVGAAGAGVTETATKIMQAANIVSQTVKGVTSIAKSMYDPILEHRLNDFQNVLDQGRVPAPKRRDEMCTWAAEYMMTGRIQSVVSETINIYPKNVSETLYYVKPAKTPGKGPQLIHWKNKHVGIYKNGDIYHWNDGSFIEIYDDVIKLFGKPDFFYPITIE